MTGPWIPYTQEHRQALLEKIDDHNKPSDKRILTGIAQEDLSPWEQRLSVEMKDEGLIRYYGMGFHALVAACKPVRAGDTKCGLALTEEGKKELERGRKK